MSKTQNLEAMRHSLAHIMAYAIQKLHPEAKFGVGPVIKDGFYYDFLIKKPLSIDDLTEIEAKMKEIIKENLSFTQENLPISKAIKYFQDKKQDFKVELINDLKQKGTTDLRDFSSSDLGIEKNVAKISTVSVYKVGDFVDLCRGPHLKNTNEVGSFKLTKVSGAYWRGNEKNPQLQRIYGVAFSNEKELKTYFNRLKEADEHDHRLLGQKLDLFIHSELVGAGLPLFTERGTIIINQMMQNMRELNKKNSFKEVRTGHLTRDELYKISGHEEKFGDDLFRIKSDEDILVLKPMNCPHHIQIYASKTRSYRDLPIRFAEFSTLHRNEVKGALGGLTRVRALTQDDAHSFVREDQIESELKLILNIADEVLTQYGLKYSVRLSTRDKNNMQAYLGDDKIWIKAEEELEKLIKKFKLKYEIKEGEAAFYGPKMDFMALDALGREWQISTIQLDFNLPSRFKLGYVDDKGNSKTPVLIHRGLNGTFERTLGILIEHYAGAFPTWLAPYQVRILPVSDKYNKYAFSILQILNNNNLRVEIDDGSESLGKKIRNGELMKIPYLLVVGEKEQKTNKVAIRSRRKGDEGSFDLEGFIKRVEKEISSKT